MRAEIFRRQPRHRSRAEEIASTLLGAAGLLSLAALVWIWTP